MHDGNLESALVYIVDCAGLPTHWVSLFLKLFLSPRTSYIFSVALPGRVLFLLSSVKEQD